MYKGGSGFHCPRCGGDKSNVLDTRVVASGDGRHRRRECVVCGCRFDTIEIHAHDLTQYAGEQTAMMMEGLLARINNIGSTASEMKGMISKHQGGQR